MDVSSVTQSIFSQVAQLAQRAGLPLPTGLRPGATASETAAATAVPAADRESPASALAAGAGELGRTIDGSTATMPAAAAASDVELARAASEFEAVFVGLLLQQLRGTADEGGLFGGDQADVLGGLFDQFMGDHLAKSASLGIAQMVETYLKTAHYGRGMPL